MSIGCDLPPLKNLVICGDIEKCLSFIKQHDPELYVKFELSAVNQERETI